MCKIKKVAWTCAAVAALVRCVLAPASAQPVPDPATMTAKDGTIPFVAWLDSVWVDHLVARAETSAGAPLFREAFLRDALRVNRARTETLLALARHYRETGLTPMDRLIAAYGRQLTPANAAWKEFTAPTRAETPAWSEDDEARYQQSARAFAAGEYLVAEVELRNLLHAHPADRRIVMDLGLLYIQTADWGMAAAAFSYAVELYPDLFDAANNLAISFDQVGRPDLVPPVLERLLKQRPDDVYLIRNIANYAFAAGDLAKARTFAARWLALDPDSAEAKSAVEKLATTGEVKP